MTEYYKRIKKEDDKFEILGLDGTPLRNHRNNVFPLMTESESQILTDDLNDLIKDKEDPKIEHEGLTFSFVYCMMATLMEHQQLNVTDGPPEIKDMIQWDRLFRLSPSPRLQILEMNCTEAARDYFGELWLDLPLNYCESEDEMKNNQVAFVSDEIIEKAQTLVSQMNNKEFFVIKLLFQNIKNCSIVLPVLWVSKKISSADFIKSYWALYYEEDVTEYVAFENEVEVIEDEDEVREACLFLNTRLEFLRKILDQV